MCGTKYTHLLGIPGRLIDPLSAVGECGALNGKLFNDELDFPHAWLPEARRYYTNIVGKYGPQVVALLNKASSIVGLENIKFLCPLHGPVWRKDLGYIIDKYTHWATYEPEEKGVMIVYASMYGNTEAAAEVLAAKLTARGVTNTRLYDVSSTHVSQLISESFRCSHIVIASVTYNMDFYPPVRDYLEDMKALALKGRTFALMENGTWAPNAGKLMGDFITEELGGTLLEPRVTMKSTLSGAQAGELEALADAVAADVKGK